MGILRSFTGIMVGTALLPSIHTGVGGAAGRVANLAQPLFAVGVVGHAAKGAKNKLKGGLW